MDLNDQQQQLSVAACPIVKSRYAFSPFSVIFSQEVREKTVVDVRIKCVLNNFNFQLKTVAHRCAHTENNENHIMIFVEISESFLFLDDRSNWPTKLAGCNFKTKIPSILPQPSRVLPSVSLLTDWNEFV